MLKLNKEIAQQVKVWEEREIEYYPYPSYTKDVLRALAFVVPVTTILYLITL